MTTQQIVLIVAVIAIIAFLAARGVGPRVTQIDRTVRKEKDVPEDRDDA
jgi:hypothetical protein